jgi:hypothetical protein
LLRACAVAEDGDCGIQFANDEEGSHEDKYEEYHSTSDDASQLRLG